MPGSAGLPKLTLPLLLCLTLWPALALADQEEKKGGEDAPEVIKTHSFAGISEPKYAPDFEHFDYVNPNAPKGGELIRAAVGSSYDSFNAHAQRGTPVANALDLMHDSMMTPSYDEIGVYYPLIAEAVEYPEDYMWVIFHINPDARDQAGKPLTAEDVAFSFNKFMEEGIPQYRTYFRNVKDAEVLDKHRVKFRFENPGRDEIDGLASMTILPKHFWEERDLSAPLREPPVASGPYGIKSYRIGQSVTYELNDDYWARDLPSRRGMFNFKQLRFDYFRDATVALEAFKAGDLDFRQEHIAKQWAEDYDFPAMRRGSVVREEIEHSEPQPMQAMIFNTRDELFQDRRVRQAINYALDFDWLNANLFYDQYARTVSYFQNTEYAAEGKPSEAELEILEPFADQLPEEVFGEAWRPETSDGSGNIRPALRKAMALLQEAGWELKDRRLTHKETGQRFEFELIYRSPSIERAIQPFRRNLERIGITANLRQTESSQFVNRVRSMDYQVLTHGFVANPYPHRVMAANWHSDYVETTSNLARVEDPVIDYLMEGIAANQQNPEKLKAYGQAFDRVAMWNFYVVPNWHSSHYRIAYWDKYARPEQPRSEPGLRPGHRYLVVRRRQSETAAPLRPAHFTTGVRVVCLRN